MAPRSCLPDLGGRLVCVRYRYDAERKLRPKIVELVVETVPRIPRSAARWREPNHLRV